MHMHVVSLSLSMIQILLLTHFVQFFDLIFLFTSLSFHSHVSPPSRSPIKRTKSTQRQNKSTPVPAPSPPTRRRIGSHRGAIMSINSTNTSVDIPPISPSSGVHARHTARWHDAFLALLLLPHYQDHAIRHGAKAGQGADVVVVPAAFALAFALEGRCTCQDFARCVLLGLSNRMVRVIDLAGFDEQEITFRFGSCALSFRTMNIGTMFRMVDTCNTNQTRLISNIRTWIRNFRMAAWYES